MSVVLRAGFAFAVFVLFVTQPLPASSGMLESQGVLVPPVDPAVAGYAPGEVLVKFKAGTPASEKVQAHAVADVDVLSEIREIGVQRVKSRLGESTEALLQRYKQNPDVEYAEPNVIYHARIVPNDPRFSDLWGLHNTGQSGGTVDADIDAPEAWDSQIGNNSVVIADIDGGMDLNHPDLAANLWINPGEIAGNGIDDDGNGYVDDYRGWDFYNGDNNPSDDGGHGTHTAGTIAAVGNNGVGVTGVAWQAKIMPLKFLNASGNGFTSDAINAILYAANMGVKIANNSWGCNGFSCFSQALEDAIAYANAAGMLFVVAAGNDGTNNDVTPDHPCVSSQPNVVCVAATTRTDQLASFSNYGAATVDLGAPGASILSTVPNGSCAFCDPSRYLFASGTSMAAPHVSGAAALILSQFPSYTLTQLKDTILGAVDLIPALAGQTTTGGRLNVERALLSNFTVTAAPASQTVNAGGSTSYTVSVNSIGTFTGPVTLTFSASNAGLAGSFSPGTVTVPAGGTATSTLSVSTSTAMTAGSYPATIRGAASSETHSTTVTVEIAPPDLIMTAVDALSTTVEPGDLLNVSNTVQNQGGSNAGAFAIAFHLSVDAVYGGTDDIVLAPTRSISTLGVGASSGATSIVTAPSSTPQGSYYVCAMADSGGTIAEGTAESNNTLCDTSPIDVAVTTAVRLINISTRAFVGTASNVAVGGFIISGAGSKQVLLRGFGPTLTSFGITGALANPALDLYWDDDNNPNTAAILVVTNDDWGTPLASCPAPMVACGTPQDIASTGMSADSYAPTNPNRNLDAALLVTLPPGTYTARLRGVNNGTGVGLIGVDDMDASPTAKLINISTRAFVGTGTSAAVGGFIISGTSNKQTLLRGFGPTLTSFGITGALANPTVDLYWDDDNNPSTPAILVLTNNDWGMALTSCPAPVVACGTPQDLANTGMSADSYAPTNPNRALDAALLVTLPPGTYTATLRGVSNGTGVGLIGVDEVGP